MQFTWNIAQGVSSYNKQTGFGFVIGAVYNANAALRIPETNSSFLPQWWYAGTAICDVTCTEYGVQATATDAVRAEDLECRSLPVWFRVDVPAEGVYRTKITVTGTDGGEVLVFIGRRRLVWRGTLAAGENKTITAYCDVFPIVPRGQVDAVPSTAVNVTVVGGALAAAAVAEAPDVRRIWVCGDSTVTDQTANLPYAPGTSYCGWGQMLPAYLPDVCITNHAHSGLTTESFTSEGHWDIVKPRLRAGDICLYQFGHNDQKLAHLQAYGGYTDRLRTYIKEARTAGAVPVLVTPLARNSWKDAAHYNDFLADFADAVLTLGKAENVMVLDLHTWAMALMQQDGLETAKRWFYPGDYTHTNDFGAYKMAGFVAHALGDALGLMVTDAPEWTPTPPFVPLEAPADCAIPAPEGDPFADYDATRPNDTLTRAEALELAIKDETLVAALNKWVYNGGVLLGVEEPSAVSGYGDTFRMARILGVDEDTGARVCHGRWPVQEEPVDGLIPDGATLKTHDHLYMTDGGTRVLAEVDGTPAIAAHAFGKGRGVYMAGFEYSPVNARMLLNLLLWAKGLPLNSDWLTTDPETEAAWFPADKTLVVINNSTQKKSTVVKTPDGDIAVDLDGLETKILPQN